MQLPQSVTKSAAALAALIVLATSATAEEVLLDGIAAQVGGEIVLLSEVAATSGPMEARMLQAGATEDDIEKMRAEALERAIERALIRQVVRRAELDSSDPEVDDAIAGIAKENGLSPAQLRRSVEAQGMPYAIYRERIRGEIEHAKVMNGIVAQRVRINEDELKQRYRELFAAQPEGGAEFFVRHILVPASRQRPLADACALAAEGRARITAGESFAQIAREISRANPRQGGALGWLHENELAAWMKPVVLALGESGLSDVVEAPFGCNLIALEQRREYTPVSFEQAQEKLHAQLFNEKMQIEYTKFVETLRSETYIQRQFASAADAAEEETAPGGGAGPAAPSGAAAAADDVAAADAAAAEAYAAEAAADDADADTAAAADSATDVAVAAADAHAAEAAAESVDADAAADADAPPDAGE